MAHLVTVVALIVAVISSISAKPADPLVEDKDDGSVGESGDYFDGDILLTDSQKEAITDPADPNGFDKVAKPWPNRTVVYHINENEFGAGRVKNIMDAMADIESKSCITFRQKDHSTTDHTVQIRGQGKGCFSHLGYRGDLQDQVLNLGAGCFRKGTIIHEFLHTLGFLHMSNNKNRDEFITIHWENVKPGYTNKFAKYAIAADFGQSYDYGSVTHFPNRVYSANGKATIIPKEDKAIGQRDELSGIDILKLKIKYNCSF